MNVVVFNLGASFFYLGGVFKHICLNDSSLVWWFIPSLVKIPILLPSLKTNISPGN